MEYSLPWHVMNQEAFVGVTLHCNECQWRLGHSSTALCRPAGRHIPDKGMGRKCSAPSWNRKCWLNRSKMEKLLRNLMFSSVLLTRVALLDRAPCFISSSSWRPCSCKRDLSGSSLAMCHSVIINFSYVSSPPSLCSCLAQGEEYLTKACALTHWLACHLHGPGSWQERRKRGWTTTKTMKDGG